MPEIITTMVKPEKKDLYDLRMFLQYKSIRRRRTKKNVDLAKQKTNFFTQADSRDLRELVYDETVTLIVTSPPYNCGQEYDLDLTLTEYLDYLMEVEGKTFNEANSQIRALFRGQSLLYMGNISAEDRVAFIQSLDVQEYEQYKKALSYERTMFGKYYYYLIK